MPTIKRYPNRKLYNTETKQYITLDELAELVRDGQELEVIDNASGDDLTVLTMTQVLFEQVKKQAGFVPRTILAGLIQAGGHRMPALHRMITSTLGLDHSIDDEIQKRLESLIKKGDLSELEGRSLLDKLLTRLDEDQESPQSEADIITRVLEEYGVARRGELQKLMEQVDSLNSRLDGALKERRASNEAVPD